MSLPWSSKGVKATPVNADELLILDSADANPATVNKRITIGSLPTGSISPLTTKGDVYTFDTADQRLPVGIDGQILSADSVETTGLKWIPVPDSGVTSINADTTAAQIMAAGTGLNIVDGGAIHTYSIDGTVVTLTGVQTLTNKTLTLPVISDFTNSVHDHSNAVGGGQLTNSALLSGVFSSITGLGIQTQNLDMGTNKIINVVDPTNPQDVVTQAYGDANYATPLTTKGDIFGYSTTNARIPVGADGLVVTANSAVALGVDYQTKEFTGTRTADVDMGAFGIIFSADIAGIAGTNKYIANEFGTLWYNVETGSQHDFAINNLSLAAVKILSTVNTLDLKNTTQLLGALNVQFGNSATLPSSFLRYIQYGTVPGFLINAAAADTTHLSFDAVNEYSFDQTQADFQGNNLTNLSLTTSVNVSNALNWADGVKQIFNPDNTNAGINVGANATEPSTPVNGDMFYDSTNDELKARINAAWVALGSGGGSANQIIQLNTSMTVTDTGADGLANTVIDGVSKIQSNVNRTIMNATRFETAKATTDSNISGNVVTLNNEGNYFEFNNTVATLDGISTTDWQPGSIINLRFRDADATGVTLVNQASTTPPIEPLFLIGSTNFQVTNANDETIFTFMWDGTNWVETNRNVVSSQTPWASDIDGATFDLLNSGFLEQNEITEPTDPAAGLVRIWSELDSGINLIKYKGSDGIVQNILQDDIVIARNTTGVTITAGQVVRFTGATGNKITIALAKSDVSATMPAIGVARSDILNNAQGPVLVRGRETDINTSAFTAGDILYVSETTAGGLTATEPVHPNISQVMGVVVVDSATVGEVDIFVGTPTGDETGTNSNSFKVGDALAGAKTVDFVNTFTASLSWNPTAARTLTLPDVTDTIVGKNTADIFTNKSMTNATNTITGVFGITGLATQVQLLNMGNFTIEAVDTPVNGTDAANKTYVDNLVNGLSWKNPAVVATTGNITLSGNQTIDGVLTVNGDRVLVKDQTSGQFNGVYNSDTGAWTRTTDTDSESDLLNMSIYISLGSTQADTAWVLTTDAPIVVDTTVLNYAQVGAGAGNPLTTKGDVFGYDTANNRIPVGTDGQVLTANSAVALGVDYQSKEFVGPWTANHDAGGFNLINLAVLESNATNPAVSGTIRLGDTEQIMWRNNANNADIGIDVNNDIFNIINAVTITGSSTLNINFQSATANFDAVNVSAGLDVGGASITSVLEVEFDPGGQIIFGTGETIGIEVGDMIFNVPTTDFFSFDIATVPEYTFSATQADFQGNNLTNLSLTTSVTVSNALNWADGVRQIFNPDATNSGLNVGAQADPDPTSPINGDIYYNSTNNKFRAYEGGSWIDMIGGGGGSQTPWTSDIDAAGFNLGFKTASPITMGQGATDVLSITYLDDTVDAGVRIGNTDGFVSIANESAVVNDAQTVFTMRSGGATTIQNIMNFTVPVADDSGTVPYLRMNFEDSAGGSIGRPLLELTNAGTLWLEISNSTDWTFHTATTFIDLQNILFTGVTNTDASPGGFTTAPLSLAQNTGITWDGAAVSTPNSIGFSSSDAFQVFINNALQFQITDIATNFLNGLLQGVAGYEFQTGTADMVGTATDLELNGPTNVSFHIGDTQKFFFNGSFLDMGNLHIKNLNSIRGISAGTPIILKIEEVASAVEYIEITNAITGVGATLSGNGTATDVDLNIATKGAGDINILDYTVHDTNLQQKKGIIASASSMAPREGNFFDVTGTTTINYIVDDIFWQAGSQITLQFDGVLTLTHNAGTVPTNFAAMLLTGDVDFTVAAGDLITLVFDGLTWLEVSRASSVVAEVTTWTADHSAARFNLENTGAIDFSLAGASTLPATTQPYITYDDELTPEAIVINVPTGDEIRLHVGGTEEYTFSSSTFNGNGNILQNFTQATIESSAGAIVILENTQSSPAPGTTTANIRFRGDRVAASAFDYGRIEVVMGDTSSGSADGEMQLMVGNANTENVEYVTLNEGNAQTIHFKKNLQDFTMDPTTGTAQINGLEGLVFTDDATILGGSNNFIQKHTDNMIYNVETGDGHLFTINGTTEFSMSSTALDVNGNDVDNIQNLIHDISASGTDIDFDEDELQTISISANTVFTTANRAAGRSKVLKITTDGTLRTLTFPGWDWTSAIPADQAANKNGYLTLTCFSTTDASIVASYIVGSL